MYKIDEIIKGAPKLVWSVLNKKREYKIKFNKEKDGCWYVDFPNWPFSHDNLAMVSGADKMCELLADGDLFVEVSVIPANKLQELDDYIELAQTEHSLFGGSTYQVKYEPFVNKFKRDSLWICPVTLFVLGRYPKYIYIRRIEDDMKKLQELVDSPESQNKTEQPKMNVPTFTVNDFSQFTCDDNNQPSNSCESKQMVLDIGKIWEQNGKREGVMIPFVYNFYMEALFNYTKEHQDTIFHIQVDDDIKDFPVQPFARMFWPALHMKNIILPKMFQLILSAIFPWDDIKACIDKKIPARSNHLSCPFCGKASEELEWINFNSPAWTWQKLCGRQGPLSICPDCHCQVEFICEIMN